MNTSVKFSFLSINLNDIFSYAFIQSLKILNYF